MAEQKLFLKSFIGGISPNEKAWLTNSSRFQVGLTQYEDPNYLTNGIQTAKASGSTVDALVHWIEDGSPWDTNRYFYAANGKVFAESSAGAWSTAFTVSNSTGNGLKAYGNYLYNAATANLHRYGPLDGTAVQNLDFYRDGFLNIDQDNQRTGSTYNIPASITETPVNRFNLEVGFTPLYQIILDFNSYTSGNVTITIHDYEDNELATVTRTSGLGAGNQTFTFSPSVVLRVGGNYHFHVTTTGTGVLTTDNSTLGALFSNRVWYQTYFDPLMSAVWHPMAISGGQLLIGNADYVARFDGAVLEPNALTLDFGYHARSITTVNEYTVIGAVKTDDTGDLSKTENSRLYFWDGIEPVPNFYQDVPQGVVNALHTQDNFLYGVYGDKGGIYVGTSEFVKIAKRIPSLDVSKKVFIYPGAMTTWQQRLHIGYCQSTTDTTSLVTGVYEYGRGDQQEENSLNFGYKISTGSSDSDVTIGSLKGIGDNLYIGWGDNGTYGVDKVNVSGTLTAAGSYESLIFDNASPDNVFLPFTLVIKFLPLTTGQTLTPKVKLDRGAWQPGTAAGVGDDRIEMSIYTRCDEIQMGFDWTSPSNAKITITEIQLMFDDLTEERGD